ncbi:MAG: class II aldolase/adducin family protein, partial [Acidobacteriota bacterium]
MKNRWSEEKAAQFAEIYKDWGPDLSVRLYSSSLIGSEESLVLHGGGNASVKTVHTDLLGDSIEAIFVKASGYNMVCADPASYTGLHLEYLRKLRTLSALTDEKMANEFRTHFLSSNAAAPSIETLLHAFIQGKFVDHTHPDAILAVSNQLGGEERLKEALGSAVPIVRYLPSGFKLANAVADIVDASPDAKAVVLMHHGLATWG